MKDNKTIFRGRPAIAMIELIFAIVVMGIVMMSAPMLIDRSTQSTYTALQQESIATAAVQIDTILTAQWDHWDTNDTIGEPVLETNSTIITNCTTDHPVGVTAVDGRYCKDIFASNALFFTASSTLGTEGGESIFYDDIDDFENQDFIVSVYNSEVYQTYQGDYIDLNITVKSRIYYGDDVPNTAAGTPGVYGQNTTFSNPFKTIITGGTTNIKLINVTLTSTNPAGELNQKNISLSAFMCNIGAPKQIANNESSL